MNIARTKFVDFFKQLYKKIQHDDVQGLSAQLAFYLILSFFPFLIFIMTIIGYASISIKDKIKYLEEVMPAEAVTIIEEIVNEVSDGRSQALLSFGMLATLWTASRGINAIIKGLNRAYDIGESRVFWKVRGISLLVTLGIGLVILLSALLLVFGTWLRTKIIKMMDLPEGLYQLMSSLQYAVPVVIMFIVFSLLYWIAPNRRISFKEVLPGAAFTTISWILTSVLFSLYVNQFGDFSKTYGSLGGVTILLIWLYISSVVLLVGGEINAILVKRKQH